MSLEAIIDRWTATQIDGSGYRWHSIDGNEITIEERKAKIVYPLNKILVMMTSILSSEAIKECKSQSDAGKGSTVTSGSYEKLKMLKTTVDTKYSKYWKKHGILPRIWDIFKYFINKYLKKCQSLRTEYYKFAHIINTEVDTFNTSAPKRMQEGKRSTK